MDSKTMTDAKVGNPVSNRATTEEQANLFNKVLRGEISAVEGYKQVADKFENDPKIVVIQNILSDHVDTVEQLKRHINVKPNTAQPDKDSGIWGTFVSTFLATAKALGEGTTISALIEGEEHGLRQYQELMDTPTLSLDDKDLIRSKFLPRQESHIRRLRELQN